MACRRCEERGKTWSGDDPVCGFDAGGNFGTKNWNCATLNALRDAARDLGTVVWSDDDQATILPGPQESAAFVVLRWYKERGRTDEALWMEGGKLRPITLQEAEESLQGIESQVAA
ncbi:MAG: hypothetical protein WBM00_08785 [Solirubrobacterales bacterium]